MLVILSLVIQLYVDAIAPGGVVEAVAPNGVPIAAILMPAGFFFSSMGRGRTAPNRSIWLLYAGAVSLAAGVIALGLSLLGVLLRGTPAPAAPAQSGSPGRSAIIVERCRGSSAKTSRRGCTSLVP